MEGRIGFNAVFWFAFAAFALAALFGQPALDPDCRTIRSLSVETNSVTDYRNIDPSGNRFEVAPIFTNSPVYPTAT